MNKNWKKIIFIAVLILVFVFSFDLVLAAVSLDNPLGRENDDPREIVGNVIRALLGIVGSLTLLVFIYGGFLWVASAGNEEKITKGKNIIIWASFGLAVIFASYAMVTFIVGALTGNTQSSGIDSSTESTGIDSSTE